MNFLILHIEALIFCASTPIKLSEIKECLTEMFDTEISEEDIIEAVNKLIEKYSGDDYSYEIINVANGYQFMTKPAYQASIGILLKQKSKKRLSNSALETLSIIAYKQPVTKTELEQIRGVNCDYSVKKLLDKELIVISGKSDSVGRPMLYATSEKFLEYFGINSLKEMPTIKDFEEEKNEIG